MTNLVERLRERARAAREERTATALGDALHFEEAADEIELLRHQVEEAEAALSDTLNMLRAAHMQCGVHHDGNNRVIKARAVLDDIRKAMFSSTESGAGK